jgi:hypothetical protein
MTHSHLFAFENDFVVTLRCVPMAVRFKLDACGIKLSLRQWSRFLPEERRDLLMTPCETASEIESYRGRLVELIGLREGGEVKILTDTSSLGWEQTQELPSAVRSFAQSIAIAPPSNAQWRKLSQLQRFVLVKLSRDNHDNVNFIPAMREFGLTERHAGSRLPISSDAEIAHQHSA